MIFIIIVPIFTYSCIWVLIAIYLAIDYISKNINCSILSITEIMLDTNYTLTAILFILPDFLSKWTCYEISFLFLNSKVDKHII